MMAPLLKDVPDVHAQARAVKPHITRLLAMIDSGHCTWEELHEAAEQIFVEVEPICDQFLDPAFNDDDLIVFTDGGVMIVPAPPVEPSTPN
jgi:hypothetical protein